MLVENWAPVRGTGAGQTDSPVDLSSPTPSDDVAPRRHGDEPRDAGRPGAPHVLPRVLARQPALRLRRLKFARTSSRSTWDAATQALLEPDDARDGERRAGTKIAYPTISAGPSLGHLPARARLRLARHVVHGRPLRRRHTEPGTEIPLDTLNGNGYPFAAGAARDADRDYEPTFAPVAAGGYFWVVFHSRRTYGNLLTGRALRAEGSGTKQLWVAAIDITPNGVDPSHEPSGSRARTRRRSTCAATGRCRRARPTAGVLDRQRLLRRVLR